MELGCRRIPHSVQGDPSREMPYVRTKKFGELYAPESLSDLVLLMERYADCGHKVAAWRGQSDIDWGIDCTAYRRLKTGLTHWDSAHSSVENKIRGYERALLDDARMVGYGFHEGRRLSDLELLSVLRHYGAATRMMDFTRNAFVALWFATQANTDKYGLLMGIHPKPGDTQRVRTEQHLDMSMEKLLDQKGREEYYIFWEPRHLFERMRVQQSLFVFGNVVEHSWGGAPFGALGTQDPALPKELILIAVPPGLKEQLLEVDGYKASWKSHFGYSDRHLFPDLAGYAGVHSSGSPIESGFFSDPTFDSTVVGPPRPTEGDTMEGNDW